MKKKNDIRILLFFIFSYIFTSCSLFYRVDFDESTFEEEYDLWKKNEIKDYSFICERDIFEGMPFSCKVKVSVINGTGKVEVLENNRMDLVIEEIKSIDDIYEYIKDLKEKKEYTAKTEKKAYRLSISYDKNYHYPRLIEMYDSTLKQLDLAMPYSEKLEITDFTITNTQ